MWHGIRSKVAVLLLFLFCLWYPLFLWDLSLFALCPCFVRQYVVGLGKRELVVLLLLHSVCYVDMFCSFSFTHAYTSIKWISFAPVFSFIYC